MQSGNEIWSVYAVLQNNFFYEKIKTSSRPFLTFKKILCKKDSVKVSMLIWTNFDRLKK